MNSNILQEQIFALEQWYCIDLDPNFEPENGLCDGDTCRHSECECWDNYLNQVETQLQKQVDNKQK